MVERRSATRRAILWIAFIAGVCSPALLEAATTERIVLDRHTGIALYGFDPVAYFTDAQPLQGRPDLEYSFGGAIWRFRNPGNRAAFADRPDIYMPRFGGYDPIGLARGVARPGHPQIWLVANGRLYLFYSNHAREMFSTDPQGALAAAEAKWPAVVETLVP